MPTRILAVTAGVALLVAYLVAPIVSAAGDYGPLTVQKTSLGEVLAAPNGMTVYTFGGDMSGHSNCTGACAQYWPPVAAPADAQPAGKLSTIERADGSKQWAYDGKPLYTYSQDHKPGDTGGNGFKGLWHVVKPGEAGGSM